MLIVTEARRLKTPMSIAAPVGERTMKERRARLADIKSATTTANARPLFVQPGDFECVPGLHRRHLVRDDAGVVRQVFREPLHDFRGSGFSRFVTKDLITPVFFTPRQQEPARNLRGVECRAKR